MQRDFATYNGPTIGGRVAGDLALSGGRNDLYFAEDPAETLRAEIIEAFDQTPGDDIDFPWAYSQQQMAFEGEGRAVLLARAQDARRIVSSFEEIERDSVEVSLDENGVLNIAFRAAGSIGRLTI